MSPDHSPGVIPTLTIQGPGLFLPMQPTTTETRPQSAPSPQEVVEQPAPQVAAPQPEPEPEPQPIAAPANPPTDTPPPNARRRGRPATKAKTTTPYVEAVKVSKGTWAFRLRWKYANDDRPIVYVDRVSDDVYELIRKEYYADYKKSIRLNYKGPVPARKPASRNPVSADGDLATDATVQ